MMFFRGASGLGRCFGDEIGRMSGYMRSGWGIVMMGIGLLFVALIVVVVVLLVKRARKYHAVSQADESLEILNARFVKGEITEEDYTRMKKVLSGK